MRRPGRRRARPRLRAPGIAFLIIAMPLLMAAVNTGNNLLYLVFAATLSMIVLSPFLAWLTLRGLRMDASAPDRVTRGEPFWVRTRIENPKRILPGLAVRIERSEGEPRLAGFAHRVPARRAGLLNVRETLHKRGRHRLPPYHLVTRFPFGQVEWRRPVQVAVEVLVHPRVRILRTGLLDEWESGRRAPQRSTGDGDEFFSIREYRPGDDPRLVAWRVSARLGKWMIREMARDHVHSVVFALDSRHPGEPSEETRAQFEDAVELAASLAVSFARQRYLVALVAPGIYIEPELSKEQERKILDALALVELTPPERAGAFDEQVRNAEAQGAAVVYLSHDPATWGKFRGEFGGAVLDPREVVHA